MKKTYKKYIKFYINRLVVDYLHYYLQVTPPQFKFDINIFYSILNDLSNIKYSKETASDNDLTPLYSVYIKNRYGNNYNIYMQYLLNHSIICSSGYYKEGTCYYFRIVDIHFIYKFLNSNYYNTSLFKEILQYNFNTDLSYCFQNDNIYSIITLDNKGKETIRKSVKNLEIVEIKINIKSKVGKYITKVYNMENDRIKHSSPHIVAMRKYYMDNLQIDIENVKNHCINKYENDLLLANGDIDLINRAQNAFNQRANSILQIGDKSSSKRLRFERGKKNKRIDTNLTNMATDLRPFIIGYDQMSYLDLSNSQPVLFNIMLKEYKPKANDKLLKEMELYENITLSGRWYEYLAKLFDIKRDDAKQLWMEMAYSKNRYFKDTGTVIHRGGIKVFAKAFPELIKVIENEKKNNHADFSVGLQRIESNIFVDHICKELVEVGIMPYGMHDGLLVPKEKEEETYQIMAKILKEHLGKVPVIAINEIKRYPENSMLLKCA